MAGGRGADELSMDGSPQLPTGWRVALPYERCNFHWRQPAIYAYCGTPMCLRCAQSGGLPILVEGNSAHHAAA
jgi:hypothetical protein